MDHQVAFYVFKRASFERGILNTLQSCKVAKLQPCDAYAKIIGYLRCIKLSATHAGPINKNCKSLRKEGFLPSIL